jgi:predicted ArsR family transcriptional regulator
MVELVKDLDVTRTAITVQLDELVNAGLVEQHLERSDRPGRPKYRFSATHHAISRVLGGLQSWLVPATWKAVKKHIDEDALQQICVEVATDLADPFIRQITAEEPAERLRQLAELQSQMGRLIEVKQQDNSVEVWKYSCPFATTIDENRIVCKIDLMALEIVAGKGSIVEQMQHRFDGHPCCVYRLR